MKINKNVFSFIEVFPKYGFFIWIKKLHEAVKCGKIIAMILWHKTFVMWKWYTFHITSEEDWQTADVIS